MGLLTTAGAVADALGHTNWKLLNMAREGVVTASSLLRDDEVASSYTESAAASKTRRPRLSALTLTAEPSASAALARRSDRYGAPRGP